MKRSTGLDWLDVLIHGGVTVMLAIAGGTAVSGAGEGVVVASVFATSLAVLGVRRWWAKRHAPALPMDDDALARIEQLEARVADLEAGQVRMLELEERVDFAERLLARTEAQPQIKRS